MREPDDLDGLSGLVIPGGESTTLSMLLESSGLFDPLAGALRRRASRSSAPVPG